MSAFIVELTNRPGSLAAVAEALARSEVNIIGIAGVAVGTGGAFAFTADKEAAARTALSAGGWRYREAPTVVAALDHQPGTLAVAARRLADAGLNLEAAFPSGMDGAKVLITLAVDDPAAARGALGDLAAG